MTIPPTHSLSQASARPWPVAVIGAGPGGALVAALLAAEGVEVLLIDRATFPRFKVCGGCLNGRALAALRAAGLGALPARLGAVPLAALHLACGGGAVRVALPGGFAVSREKLDAALIREAVARGAGFLPGTTAALGGVEALGRRLMLRGPDGGAELCAEVVIAADGLGGGLMARAGVPSVPAPGARIGAGAVLPTGPPFYEPGVIWMACGSEGYVGAVRVEGGRLDVACALDARAVRHKAALGPVVARVVRESGLPAAGLEDQPWRGTPPLTRRARRVADHRLFVTGDATGYVEPFTGEGMAWALSSAVALAPLAREAAAGWRPGLARAWGERHRQVVTGRQLPCRVAASVLRRPWLARLAIRLISAFPALAGPVVAHLNQTAPLLPPPVPQGAR